MNETIDMANIVVRETPASLIAVREFVIIAIFSVIILALVYVGYKQYQKYGKLI